LLNCHSDAVIGKTSRRQESALIISWGLVNVFAICSGDSEHRSQGISLIII